MPKLIIKLPAVELDLPDKLFKTTAVAGRVGQEFHSWVKRYLPTWAWRKFARSKYPQLADQTVMNWAAEDEPSEDEATASGARHLLKPHSGEQMSDVLRQVAEVDPLSADKLAAIFNIKVTHRDHNLDAAAKFLLEYMHQRNITWNQLIKTLREHMDDVSDLGYEWVGDARNWRVQRTNRGSHGELALVLNNEHRGSYLGRVLHRSGSTIRVQHIKGHSGPSSKTNVPAAWVVYEDDKVKVDRKVRAWDEAVNKTTSTIQTSTATVESIDASKGVLVVGRDKITKASFRTWVTDFGTIESKP